MVHLCEKVSALANEPARDGVLVQEESLGGHRGLPPPVSETGTASTADAAEVMQARLKQVRMHGVVIHACSAFIVRVLAL